MEFMLHKLSSFRFTTNCSSDVMVSLLASSAVDRGFEPRSGQTKDYKIGICRFSTKHAALRRKNKDWLVWNQNNVSEWSDMSTRRLLFQWASTIKIPLIGIKQQSLTHFRFTIVWHNMVSNFHFWPFQLTCNWMTQIIITIFWIFIPIIP